MRSQRLWMTILGVFFACVLASGTLPSQAQTPPPKPFAMPFGAMPGPTTWLLSQQYGNTIGAFNYGRYWYAGGRNLHFGLDFWAPCNTPVYAIGDGEVDQVDNFSFGLEPHNLTIFHRTEGLTSVYGHLNSRSPLMKGQPVKRGDLIGYTGDPDLTCVSRPHLHLEIRSANYQIAYNPVNYIAADWVALSVIGYQGFGGFTQNLLDPRRWQTPFDQPDVDFNETPLNEYRYPYPLPIRDAPPPLTLPAGNTAPLGTGFGTFRQLTGAGCCAHASWSLDSRAVQFYDGEEGRLANLIALHVEGELQPEAVTDGQPRVFSPDGNWEVNTAGGRTTLVRRANNEQIPIATGGALPRFSPQGKRMLWHRHPADDIPGGIAPLTEIWISSADGSGRDLIRTQNGGSVYWLDEDRVLIVEPIGRTNQRKLMIYTIPSRRTDDLVTVRDLRGLSVAPGGAIILFYLPFQDDPNASGVYGLLTQAGATPVKLPFFGPYRWRDSATILFTPYLPGEWYGSLVMYSVTTGEMRPVTDPAGKKIKILNDQWAVSPDGRFVVYWNAEDIALWLVTLP